MNLKKKILAVTIIPVLVLGMVSIILTVTMVKSSVMEQVEESLKGTASSTLAAYDQNAGDYIVTTNGDIWKGSYNVSKSENLVDRIKENTGMDVTFFYGTKRVMTSALDANGERILGSPAGDVITQKVLNDGEEYFTSRVSLDGVMNGVCRNKQGGQGRCFKQNYCNDMHCCCHCYGYMYRHKHEDCIFYKFRYKEKCRNRGTGCGRQS